MESTVRGRKYIYKLGNERYPEEANKKRTDKSLDKIRSALETINGEIAAAYKEDRGLYDLIEEYIFDQVGMEFYEDRCWKLREAQDAVEELQQILSTHNDEIVPANVTSAENLLDFGYKASFPGDRFYEKTIEDTNEKEVTDEIQYVDGKPLRRQRTIIWEKTDYGKSSKTIKYKKLPISKRLAKAIAVSFNLEDKDRNSPH